MAVNGEFVFGAGPMIEVLGTLRKVAALDTTVMLQGESGTGKELAARYLHSNHPTRRRGPMISVHCGAIPETLLESELFGHVRGAFTGAERDRVGKFEQANGGTLFLDEISTMPLQAQTRLLRVLQERRVTRIGASDSRPVDVRVVVATNQDIKQQVDDGTFRLDLFYRVNTFPVVIPPLRERPGDIVPLVEHFSTEVADRLGFEKPISFTTEALQALSHYSWPGNVRELANAVEFASIQCGADGVADQADLPVDIADLDLTGAPRNSHVVVTTDGVCLRTAVTNLERELILQSLRIASGNKARAAQLLDLKRTTFLEKLRRLEQEGLVPMVTAN